MKSNEQPIALVKQGTDQVVAHACGKCGTVVGGAGEHDKDLARRHCGPWTCEKCGAEHNRSYQPTCWKCYRKVLREHNAKKETELYNKAEKIAYADYDGPLFWEGSDHNDGFFRDLDELMDWCACEDIQPPDYVWPCIVTHPHVDPGHVIEMALDDHHEDAEVVDEVGLREFFKEWNAKQTSESWEPHYRKVIVIGYPCEEEVDNE